MDLDTVTDELYALPPAEFTAARNAAVKRATDAGLKQEIKSLRRPTASAHVVNRLVRDDPERVEELLALGDELRTAMTGGTGDVRRLSEQRRSAVSALVARDLPANVADEVSATLEAATADPRLAAAVRSGRLVRPLRYAGFGEFPDLGDIVATPLPKQPKRAAAKRAGKPAAKTAARKAADKAADTAAKARLAQRERDLAAMRQQVLERSGAADDAQRRYDEATRAAVEARARLDHAEAERAAAHKAARAAHADAERARRELGRAERA